jgi:hypothetical protein
MKKEKGRPQERNIKKERNGNIAPAEKTKKMNNQAKNKPEKVKEKERTKKMIR